MNEDRYRIELAGHDISRWVIAKPQIIYSKPRLGEMIEIPNSTLIVDNSYKLFTPGEMNSLIQDDRKRILKVYERDILIYEGYYRYSIPDFNDFTAQLFTTAKINEIIGSILIPIYDSTVRTFAEISEIIYSQYGIETDTASYERAKFKQQELSLFGRISNSPLHGSSIMEIQQFLANAGICKHYFIFNKAYMDFYNPFEVINPYLTFDDDYIVEITDYSPIEKQIYDGYSIQWQSGTSEKIGLNMAPSLQADSSNPIPMITGEGGYRWGDYQIELSKIPQNTISLSLVKCKESNWLGMNSIINLYSELEGINERFEITSIDKSGEIDIKITGETI